MKKLCFIWRFDGVFGSRKELSTHENLANLFGVEKISGFL